MSHKPARRLKASESHSQTNRRDTEATRKRERPHGYDDDKWFSYALARRLHLANADESQKCKARQGRGSLRGRKREEQLLEETHKMQARACRSLDGSAGLPSLAAGAVQSSV